MTILSTGDLRHGGADTPAATVSFSAGSFALVAGEAAVTLVAEWHDLSANAVEGNAFFDPDFALPAIYLLGKGIKIATWRAADGKLAALAPVVARRLGHIAPAVRVFTHPYGPLGVPLVDRTGIASAVAGLVDGLLAVGGSLVIPEIPLEGPVADAIARYAADGRRPLATIHAYRRAELSWSGSGPVDCRAGLSTRRRKELDRQMRRLGELGDVAVTSAGEADEVRQSFEEFLALEAAGWKGQRGTALAAQSEIAAMARKIVAGGADSGTARIDAIRLDGRAIAMLVSFLSGDTAFSWKIAHDEAFAGFSPGAQLMLEAGRTLSSLPGVRRIDSCAAANHSMIDRLWPVRRAIGTLVVGPVGGGVAHNAGLAALKAEVAAGDVARRAVSRLRPWR